MQTTNYKIKMGKLGSRIAGFLLLGQARFGDGVSTSEKRRIVPVETPLLRKMFLNFILLLACGFVIIGYIPKVKKKQRTC